MGNGVEDGLKFPAFFRKTDFDGAGVFVIRDLLKVTECRKPPHHDGNRRFAASAAAREFRESQGVFGKKDDEHVPVTRFDIGVAGVAQTANNRVIILVDSAERPEDIDEIRAKEAKERAEEQLRQKQSVYEYRMSKASLARAVSRLKEKQRSHINL